MSTEKIKGNKVAATLFVGVGGIGSKIIREGSELAKNDDLSKARFVILDTDVNDLSKADGDINITAIQTSSPRTIRDYLIQDDDAREEWFPNNMIINGKTVSEGAGQVRAISRLALNATIKTGRIKPLYRAIDDLYDKDGSDKRQTVKIIIASTVAGGTGSGIAMIVAMLIRNYITENYPDSSAIIRGFMLMPGVMDTVNPATTEKLSLQRNGYATIKEINAFMMRPFFEAVPELRRYLDLNVEVPNAVGGIEKLTCSPFDFCFLFDRTDENVSNMASLDQYRSYAAHSIYEQCIGPMSNSAASKEDNIHKEFLDDQKLSRNRFGGAGAAVVRYPYEQIRDYIAYDWIEKQLVGISSENATEEQRKAMVANSWLVYDKDFYEREKAFRKDPFAAASEEPNQAEVYVRDVETGSEPFTKQLMDKYINPTNEKYKEALNRLAEESEDGDDDFDQKKDTIAAVEYYIQQLVKRGFELCESAPADKEVRESFLANKTSPAPVVDFLNRYSYISTFADFINPDRIETVVRAFINRVFNNSNPMQPNAEPYSMEAFCSLNGKALHPNAMRYMMYKLETQLIAESKTKPEFESYLKDVDVLLNGPMKPGKSGERNTKKYSVTGNGAENSLRDMCNSCDESSMASDKEKRSCNNQLTAYAETVNNAYEAFVRYYVCDEAKKYLRKWIEQFQEFYKMFEGKVGGLEKRKQTLLAQVAFKNGDCEYHLFNKPEHLKMLVAEQNMPSGGGQHEASLYAAIYNSIKRNAQVKDRIAFTDEVVEDVFDDVIVEHYKTLVAESCKEEIDLDILRACGLEHKIICLCEANDTPNETKKEKLRAKGAKLEEKNAHLFRIIEKGKLLASPSIIRKDFEESRPVDAMSYNIYLEEREGMKMPAKYFDSKNASDTVSKYELRFFRSIYNLMPIQLQKLCSPQADPAKLSSCVDAGEQSSSGMVGAYFTAYQEYMTKIGPDNRLNPVITPHIDKRWNSITVLPELDPIEYQRVLMKRIHKAMIYGFILQLIEKRSVSKYDPDKLVYEYIDGRNGTKSFIVSNHTKCDRLFEVLDSLYFDRYAVHSIHSVADNKRQREFECSTLYEETTFAQYLPDLDRMLLIDDAKRRALAKEQLDGQQVSLFEIPLLYWNSLPKKDATELEIMVDAIFEILETEISTFADKDDISPLVAKSIREHYNLLHANYHACKEVFGGHDEIEYKDNPAIKVIRKKVLEKIDDLDVSRNADFALVDQTKRDALFV